MWSQGLDATILVGSLPTRDIACFWIPGLSAGFLCPLPAAGGRCVRSASWWPDLGTALVAPGSRQERGEIRRGAGGNNPKLRFLNLSTCPHHWNSPNALFLLASSLCPQTATLTLETTLRCHCCKVLFYCFRLF